MITITCENTSSGAVIPEIVLATIEMMNNKNRVLVSASITSIIDEDLTRSGQPAPGLGYIKANGDSGFCGWRMSIESQLIKAGIIDLGLNCIQQFALKDILKSLNISAGYGYGYNVNLSNSCFKYSIMGYLDRALEKHQITDLKYLAIREKLRGIRDPFSEDFEWYFGQPVPQDCYKGME